MEGMITIIVQLQITRENGKVNVEMIGQCEGEHKKLVLYMFEQKVDKLAEKLDVEKLSIFKDHEPYQFYRAFSFLNEEELNRFIKELQAEQ